MSLKKNIIAFLIIGTVGTLSHFVYGWSGENQVLGYIFPVNESTWEHLKLLFFPTLAYSLIEYLTLKEKPDNYLFATAAGLFCGMLSIITLFYTISGILGYNLDFINIAIYFIALIITLIKRTKILNTHKHNSKFLFYIALFYLIFMFILFIIFTYNPPNIQLFKVS